VATPSRAIDAFSDIHSTSSLGKYLWGFALGRFGVCDEEEDRRVACGGGQSSHGKYSFEGFVELPIPLFPCLLAWLTFVQLCLNNSLSHGLAL
jgi:hypothetical protein